MRRSPVRKLERARARPAASTRHSPCPIRALGRSSLAISFEHYDDLRGNSDVQSALHPMMCGEPADELAVGSAIAEGAS